MSNYQSLVDKVVELTEQLKGGKGSGNFGHAGRPGKQGGSSSKGGSSLQPSPPPSNKSFSKKSKGKKQSLKKLTIQKAASMLSEKGYKLGQPKVDLKNKVTSYEVTDRKGNTKMMTTDEIKNLILG